MERRKINMKFDEKIQLVEKKLNERFPMFQSGRGYNSFTGASNNYIYEKKLLNKTFGENRIKKIREWDDKSNGYVYNYSKNLISRGWSLDKQKISKSDILWKGHEHHISNKKGQWHSVWNVVVKNKREK